MQGKTIDQLIAEEMGNATLPPKSVGNRLSPTQPAVGKTIDDIIAEEMGPTGINLTPVEPAPIPAPKLSGLQRDVVQPMPGFQPVPPRTGSDPLPDPSRMAPMPQVQPGKAPYVNAVVDQVAATPQLYGKATHNFGEGLSSMTRGLFRGLTGQPKSDGDARSDEISSSAFGKPSNLRDLYEQTSRHLFLGGSASLLDAVAGGLNAPGVAIDALADVGAPGSASVLPTDVGDPAHQFASQIRGTMPDPQTFGGHVGALVGDMAPMIAGGAVAGPAGMAGTMGAMTFGQTYGSTLDQLQANNPGMNPTTAKQTALSTAAVVAPIDTAINMVPGTTIGNRLAGISGGLGRMGTKTALSNLAKDMGMNAAAEGGSSTIQQMGQMSAGIRDQYDIGEAGYAAAVGGAMSLGIGGAHEGVRQANQGARNFEASRIKELRTLRGPGGSVSHPFPETAPDRTPLKQVDGATAAQVFKDTVIETPADPLAKWLQTAATDRGTELVFSSPKGEAGARRGMYDEGKVYVNADILGQRGQFGEVSAAHEAAIDEISHRMDELAPGETDRLRSMIPTEILSRAADDYVKKFADASDMTKAQAEQELGRDGIYRESFGTAMQMGLAHAETRARLLEDTRFQSTARRIWDGIAEKFTGSGSERKKLRDAFNGLWKLRPDENVQGAKPEQPAPFNEPAPATGGPVGEAPVTAGSATATLNVPKGSLKEGAEVGRPSGEDLGGSVPNLPANDNGIPDGSVDSVTGLVGDSRSEGAHTQTLSPPSTPPVKTVKPKAAPLPKSRDAAGAYSSKTKILTSILKKAKDDPRLNHEPAALTVEDVIGDNIDDSASRENRAKESYTFQDKLPGEIKNLLEGRAYARQLFKVAKPGEKAGGEDWFEYVNSKHGGEAYEELVDWYTRRGRVHDERLGAMIKQGFHPEAAFMRELADRVGSGKVPTHAIDNPVDSLPIDAEFKSGGRSFRVELDAEDVKVMTDSVTGKQFPLGAFDSIPIDQGTIRRAKPKEVVKPADDVPFSVGDNERVRDLFGKDITPSIKGKQGDLIDVGPSKAEREAEWRKRREGESYQEHQIRLKFGTEKAMKETGGLFGQPERKEATNGKEAQGNQERLLKQAADRTPPAETQAGGSGFKLENPPEQKRLFSVGKTIDVDGVKRPAENSDGQPIHPTEDGIRNFWRWFKGSKLVDNLGRPIRFFHGASRSDRIAGGKDVRFRKDRATSGPMGFFTDNSEIGGSYSSKKQDTSLETPESYAGWFKATRPGSKQKMNAVDLWNYMSPEERAQVAAKIQRVNDYNPLTQEELDVPVLGPTGTYGAVGKSHWDYTIKQHRGNVLAAASDIWLDSGKLFDQERTFLKVLELAGVKGVEAEFPTDTYPGVIPAYINITNPLLTSNIPPAVIDALEKAARRQPMPKERRGVDPWDKRSHDPRDWIEQLREDIASDTTHSWTSIPDWVTRTLKAAGYDGIRDSGGKHGGIGHTVAIPFEENQVKSAVGNRGTFDPAKKDIRFSVGKGEEDRPIGQHSKLTPLVIERMRKDLKSQGYDIRGSADAERMIKQIVKDGQPIWHEDYAKAYQRALGSVEKQKAKSKTLKEETPNVDWERIRSLPTTTDPREAGYIRPNGTLLDLSGKSEGGQPGMRSFDHREAGGTIGMQEIMAKAGWVRWMPEANGFDIAKEPTPEQYNQIRQLSIRAKGEIVVDMKNGLGSLYRDGSYYNKPDRTWNGEYPEGTRPEKIIGDIRRFFAGEAMPESGPRFSVGAKSDDKAPIWFSKLSETVNQKMGGSMDADQLRAMLKSAGVKAEEMQYAAIDELQGKVTKAQVLEHLRENAVTVTEKMLGHSGEYPSLEKVVGPATEAMNRNDWLGFGSENEAWRSVLYADDWASRWEVTDPTDIAAIAAWREVKQEKAGLRSRETKFGPDVHPTMSLPGGKDYRELLLKLPEKKDVWTVKHRKDGAYEVVSDGGGYIGPMSSLENATRSARDNNARGEVNRKQTYQSGHFPDEPNILAHIRFNSRTDAAGKKVLFLEEIQSDWHQTGRDQGYRDSEKMAAADLEYQRLVAERDAMIAKHNEYGNLIAARTKMTPEERRAEHELSNRIHEVSLQTSRNTSIVPDAPFKKTWHELAMKRMIRYAAENGYDSIAWTTGEQQAARYDLSKQVDAIRLSGDFDQSIEVSVAKPGEGFEHLTSTTKDKLADVVGKEIAKKALEGDQREFTGLDLKVGGEGMKGFYDKILPNSTNALIKKYGGRVGEVKIPGAQSPDDLAASVYGRGTTFESLPESSQAKILEMVKKRETAQHGFDITPSMKAEAMQKGMQLFSVGPKINVDGVDRPTRDSEGKPIHPTEAGIRNFWKWFGNSKVVDKSGAPIRVYHGTAAEFNTFKIEKFGQRDDGWYGKGFYFTPDPDVASQYSESAKDRPGEKRTDQEAAPASNVIPAYVSLQNPYTWPDGRIVPYNRESRAALAKELRDGGYDGVLVPIHGDTDGNLYELVAFDPTQIKSATGNTGEFSPDNPDIRFSVGPAGGPTPEQVKKTAKQMAAEKETGEPRELIGRPDLANPVDPLAADGKARGLVDAIDEARNQLGIPPVKTDAETFAQADDILRNSTYAKEGQRLLDIADKGGQLSDVDTLVAQRVVSSKALEAIFSGDESAFADAVYLGNAYRETGTEQARAFRQRRDQYLTPAERLAGIITAPSKETLEQTNKLKDQLDKATDPKERAAITAKLKAVSQKTAKQAKQITQAIRAQGINPATLSPSQLSDPAIIHRVARAATSVKATIPSRLQEYWINSLLSGPMTHMANLEGNLISGAWEVLGQRLVEIGVNKVIRNKGRDASQIGDYRAMARGIFPAIQTAGRAMLRSFATEQPWFTNQILTGATGQMGLWPDNEFAPEASIKGKKGRFIRIPTRALLAADQFAQGLYGTLEAYAISQRIAGEKGLKGTAAIDYANKLVNDPSNPLWVKALDYSKELTFQADLDPVSQWFSDGRRKFWPLTFVFPFVKTPLNIFKRAIAKTPVAGQIAPMWRIGRALTDRTFHYEKTQQARDISNALIGWGITAAVWSLVSAGGPDDEGVITGSRSRKPGENNVEPPPMSIKIGKRWISYSRIEPFATQLAMIVDGIHAAKTAKDTGAFQAALGAMATSTLNQLQDKTFLKGLADLVDAFENRTEDGSAMGRWASNFASSWVPAIVRQGQAQLQPAVPDVKARVTEDRGLPATLALRTAQRAFPAVLQPEPKIDLWGQPIDARAFPGYPKTDYLYRMLVPMRLAPENTNPIDRLLMNWNNKVETDMTGGLEQYLPTVPAATVNIRGKLKPYKLSDAEYTEFLQETGQNSARRIKTLIDGGILNPANPTARNIERIKEIREEEIARWKRQFVQRKQFK